MNHIICDICGTEYPENAERCPICGYLRQGTEKVAVAREVVERTRVQGGRYSNKNARKRRRARRKALRRERMKKNKSLLLVIALLMIAIVLVTAYIGARFWGGRDAFTDMLQTGPASTTETIAPSTAAPTVPCVKVVLNTAVVELDAVGQQYQLHASPMPENTTDVPVYASSDESVATVTDTGLITAVGDGQAEISVTFGGVTETCLVDCWIPEETTLPPETTVPETTAPVETIAPTEPKVEQTKKLTLSHTDVTCTYKGEQFTIKVKLNGQYIDRSEVTWTTTDAAIATVENGVVTAVGKGEATITAEYQGKKATCIVRNSIKADSGSQNNGGSENSSGSENQTNSKGWKISHSDVSIKVGESFNLTIKNSSGEYADVIWTMSVDGVVSFSGKTITGRAPGTVTLSATVDGVQLKCIVRVK